jgi:hypothetical protein
LPGKVVLRSELFRDEQAAARMRSTACQRRLLK